MTTWARKRPTILLLLLLLLLLQAGRGLAAGADWSCGARTDGREAHARNSNQASSTRRQEGQEKKEKQQRRRPLWLQME